MCKLIGKYSSSAHELLLQFLSVDHGRCCVRGEVVAHRCAGEPLPEPEGPGECSPAHREVVTRRRGVQVRPPAGCRAVRIGYDGRLAVARPSRRSPATTRVFAARSRHPTQVRTGPARGRVVRAGRRRAVRAPLRSNTTAIGHRIPNRGASRLRVDRMDERRCRRPLRPARHSTPRFGSRTTCPPGRRARRPRPAYRLDGSRLTLDVPVDHPRVVPRRPHAAAAGLRDPVRQLVGPGRQHRTASSGSARASWSARSSTASRAGCPPAAGSRSGPG